MKVSAVLIVAVLAAVAVPLVLADGSDAAYEERTVTAYMDSMDDTADVQCRFYDDMPSIPYVRFTDVFRMFYSETLVTVDNGGGTFTMTNESGYTAVFDIVNDRITSDDFGSFKYLNMLMEETDQQNFPIDRYRVDASTDPEIDVLDLSSYHLDMRGEDEVWMPLSTASDLLCNYGMTYAVYTNESYWYPDESIFVCGYKSGWYNNLPTDMWEATFLWISENDWMRPADMIAHSYGELCLTADHLWGNVCRNEFTQLVSEVGLDAALDTYSDGSRGVKALLLDDKFADYISGLTGLDRLVYDGGHTNFSIFARAFMLLQWSDTDEYIENRLSDLSLPGKVTADMSLITGTRTAILGEGSYHVYGDTAFYIMDGFTCGDWSGYYSGGGDYPDDTIGNFLRAVDTASADPRIKNFVIDLSANGGGLVNAALYILAAITGQEPMGYTVNCESGAERIARFHMDINTDGVYDEGDLRKRADLNFGILSSRFTYSSGTILVNQAKEMGVTVIGERPGGGSATLTYTVTPEGFPHHMGTVILNTVSDFDFMAFDRGFEPDVPITVGESNGMKDFSAFYDLAAISRIMDEQHPSEHTHSKALMVPALAVAMLALLMMVGGVRRRA